MECLYLTEIKIVGPPAASAGEQNFRKNSNSEHVDESAITDLLSVCPIRSDGFARASHVRRAGGGHPMSRTVECGLRRLSGAVHASGQQV